MRRICTTKLFHCFKIIRDYWFRPKGSSSDLKGRVIILWKFYLITNLNQSSIVVQNLPPKDIKSTRLMFSVVIVFVYTDGYIKASEYLLLFKDEICTI